MLNIDVLLIEDDIQKLRRVKEGLLGKFPAENIRITTAVCIAEAKMFLKERHFHFVILDVAIPLHEDGEIDKLGGLKLLRNIVAREVYRKPNYIVGLTGYSELYQSESGSFAEDLFSLIYFDDRTDEWLNRICAKIRYVISALDYDPNDEGSRDGNLSADICIVAALDDELEPLLNNGWSWETFDIQNDPSIYYRSRIQVGSGEEKTIIASVCPQMGMQASAVQTTKIGYTFRPSILLMVGICAGDVKELSLGDLVIGNPVWDSGSGKLLDSGLEVAPYQKALTARARGIADRILRDENFFEEVHGKFSGRKPANPPQRHIGPMVSTAAVIADRKTFFELKANQHRKLIGLDMESYGVFYAVSELPAPAPDCIVLKGVQDYANSEKEDSYRNYGAYVSAQAATRICELYC